MKRLLAALLLVTFASLSIDAQLVPKDAVPEKVADGYKFTEGPALGPDGCIYFTDIPASLILKFDPESGKTTNFIENTEHANGLMWHDGNLYACSHGARAVRYYILDPELRETIQNRPKVTEGPFANTDFDIDAPQIVVDETLAAVPRSVDPRGAIEARFNSPNDLAIDKKGNVYFTDPRYGNRDDMELKVEGLYYHGELTRPKKETDDKDVIYLTSSRIDYDLTRPNGIIFSPDESILYVADHGANFIYAYDIESPGKVKNKRKFARLNDGKGGGSDGMTVDKQGRLYATGHGKVWVFEPTGQLVATLAVGKQTTNCTFGADGKTLYITANKGLYRITLNTDAPLEHADTQDN